MEQTKENFTQRNVITHKPSSKFKNSIKKYYQYYILALPGILIYLIFRYAPMVGIITAFKDYSLNIGMFDSSWVGLKWFKILFSSEEFIVALKNTIIISSYKLIFCFPAPIILSLLLNELKNQAFKRSVQTIIYLPHFLSWVVLGGIAYTFLSQNSALISLLGLERTPLMNPNGFRGFLVISEIWKDIGWGTIIYLAAITNINPELYEASTIDGANRFQQVRYITIPCITGTIVVLLILRLGQILNAGFDQIFILYNPLVYQVSDILDTYVYRVGLTMGRFSIATAAGLFKSIIGIILILLSNWLVKKSGEEGVM